MRSWRKNRKAYLSCFNLVWSSATNRILNHDTLHVLHMFKMFFTFFLFFPIRQERSHQLWKTWSSGCVKQRREARGDLPSFAANTQSSSVPPEDWTHISDVLLHKELPISSNCKVLYVALRGASLRDIRSLRRQYVFAFVVCQHSFLQCLMIDKGQVVALVHFSRWHFQLIQW